MRQLFLATAVALFLSVAQPSSAQDLASQFVGAWPVVNAVTTVTGGEIRVVNQRSHWAGRGLRRLEADDVATPPVEAPTEDFDDAPESGPAGEVDAAEAGRGVSA